ncbi:hypothetical protein [Roseovarius azorensis]|uniref:hypothetical protein n=1 Tax=Roseovarius azorensis TaxID=1287727 RepID=UPI00158745F4|nr:hypothetical protein [Roseovarius azorensis]
MPIPEGLRKGDCTAPPKSPRPPQQGGRKIPSQHSNFAKIQPYSEDIIVPEI